MSQYFAHLIVVLFILGYAAVSIWIFRRKRARRNTEPPEEFVLLRQPGETQQREIDRVSEVLDNWIMFGSPLSLIPMVVPFWIRDFFPKANLLALLVCCLVLFIIAIVVVVTKMAALLEERANRRLGYRGERHVAEQLQSLTSQGWLIFHDVPVSHENGGQENIDHVVIGPRGIVVVETKTRCKPKKDSGKKDEVSFDGTNLHWPSYVNDHKPAAQVKRCSKWLNNFIQQNCRLKPPMFQMIAIPGWFVRTGNHFEPHVTSGRAVASALETMMSDKKDALPKKDIKIISVVLDKLCRDVKD